MVRQKRWKRDWHHRAPDFKLVYCGPKKSIRKEETGQTKKRRIVKVSLATGRNIMTISKLEKKSTPKKIKQLH